MERAKILRQLMEAKSFKVADITKLSGLPYSTVKYILENGIEKASYANVQRICKALNISADDLENMVAREDDTIAAHKNGETFTTEELEKIEEYKRLLIAARPKE